MERAKNQKRKQTNEAGVIDLVNGIAYQKGTVVSKTLIKKPGGTVTLFAFGKDQELSEHTAPFDALVQVLDGTAEIKIAGRPHTVKKGEAIILPARIPHALRAVEPFKMALVMIKA